MKKSNLCVFTTGSNTDLFLQSCQSVIITPLIYTVAEWKGYVTGKLREGIKAVQDRPEDYFMWVDGNDTLILQPEEIILSKLHAMGDPILMAGESTCWPDETLREKYRKLTNWPCMHNALYINAGGFIGHKEMLLTAMHTAVAYADGTEDDQLAWTRSYLAGSQPYIQIDHSRSMFACMGDDAKVPNDVCVRHWNGRVQGRQEFWEALNVRS